MAYTIHENLQLIKFYNTNKITLAFGFFRSVSWRITSMRYHASVIIWYVQGKVKITSCSITPPLFPHHERLFLTSFITFFADDETHIAVFTKYWPDEQRHVLFYYWITYSMTIVEYPLCNVGYNNIISRITNRKLRSNDNKILYWPHHQT